MKTNLDLSTRRTIRTIAQARNNMPVEVIAGSSQAPKLMGESYHYETRGGRRIYHPSAYSKKGWGNMRYIGSSLRVTVGELYVASLAQPSVMAVAA
jgi:hypothetical protein